MQPEIHLGPITLQTFGIMFALAFIAAGALVGAAAQASSASRSTGPTRWSSPRWSAASSAPALDFIIENYDSVKDDLLGNLFSGSGLVWYGGAIGGAIGVGLWAWRRGMLNARAARPLRRPAGARLRDRPDRLPALRRRRLRQGLGRALGDGLPERHHADRPDRPSDPDLRDARDGPRRLSALAAARPIPPGVLFCIYLMLAGVERFLVEFIRRNDDVAARAHRSRSS